MKAFPLGVGAQKAGTTWLHDYLSHSSQTDLGFTKEYHVFDTLTLPGSVKFRKLITRQAVKDLQDIGSIGNPRPSVTRAAFLYDRELYFDYFARLLQRDGITLTGDITPSYAGLSAETLTLIRDCFASRGIAVRPVLLMRDPVDRLQSMVRMGFRKRKISPGYDQEVRMMQRKMKSPGTQARGDYTHTVAALDKVFGADAFFEFYEQLWCDASIRRLCDHLGIDMHPAAFDTRKNESAHVSSNELTAEDHARFAWAYRKTYAFCAQRFGHSLIERIWNPPERRSGKPLRTTRTTDAKNSSKDGHKVG